MQAVRLNFSLSPPRGQFRARRANQFRIGNNFGDNSEFGGGGPFKLNSKCTTPPGFQSISNKSSHNWISEGIRRIFRVYRSALERDGRRRRRRRRRGSVPRRRIHEFKITARPTFIASFNPLTKAIVKLIHFVSLN